MQAFIFRSFANNTANSPSFNLRSPFNASSPHPCHPSVSTRGKSEKCACGGYIYIRAFDSNLYKHLSQNQVFFELWFTYSKFKSYSRQCKVIFKEPWPSIGSETAKLLPRWCPDKYTEIWFSSHRKKRWVIANLYYSPCFFPHTRGLYLKRECAKTRPQTAQAARQPRSKRGLKLLLSSVTRRGDTMYLHIFKYAYRVFAPTQYFSSHHILIPRLVPRPLRCGTSKAMSGKIKLTTLIHFFTLSPFFSLLQKSKECSFHFFFALTGIWL